MRSQTKLALFVLAALVLFLAGPARAHHGAAAYNMASSVTIKGTVTNFQFINPHVLIFLDVKNDKGTVEKWQGELTSPNRLSRAGWTHNSLKPGDSITLTGAPSKSGAPSMWIRKVVLANGESLNAMGE